jgi:transcription initiation factor TFIIIB Brf1 subunit/transcription initiation factor TFIIB
VTLPQPALRLAVLLAQMLKRRLGALPVKLVNNLPQRPVKPSLIQLMHHLPRLAAKAAGVPRPLEDFLKCSRAEERRVRKVAWRLKEAVKLSGKPSIEDYVKTLAARVNLPASIVKAAVELLERNKRLLAGKNPWVSAAALWLASFKKLGLLKALAEAAGTTTVSIRNAANRLRV